MRAMGRIMIGVTKKDSVKNEDLRNKSRVQDIINTIKLKKSGQVIYDKDEWQRLDMLNNQMNCKNRKTGLKDDSTKLKIMCVLKFTTFYQNLRCLNSVY